MQVLYVEDNPSEAKIVEAMLRSEGHFCHTTDSGHQAVTLAKRNDYDLIILDIMLPDIDGYEVIERMQIAGVGIPFLIQSSLVDRDEKLDGLGFGVDDYLVKPFSKAELTERMESVLSRSKQTIPSRFAYIPDRRKKPRTSGSERRQHRRFSTVKTAEIIDGEERPPCVVLNLSHGGAALRLPGQQIPELPVFKLKLQMGAILQCRICWRLGDKIGVRFVEAKGG
ncbi:MAG: response regulator [Alphaproteobacteria bacterium]|nr:response regulator [Alphaproteobacteria bacterium]